MNLLEELKWRGFIKDATNFKLLEEELAKGTTVYTGFDPTGKSLHIGHLVPINLLAHLQKAGHKIITIVGGATALIGDPRNTTERPILSFEEVNGFQDSIKKQIERFIDFSSKKNPAIILNNYQWIKDISAIDFLRDYGKYFTVTYMLNKETVKSRLEIGISYTEFSYMMLQALDFLHLYKNHNCRVQFGGSDQWGNITSGVELVRKKEQEEVVGATLALITTSTGAKFGKSLGNALYLDKELTHPYNLYQYFLNSTDEDVINYLKVFTMLSRQEIERIEIEHNQDRGKRLAQKTLAYETVKWIHGNEEAENAKKISELLFNNQLNTLSVNELEICFHGISQTILNESINIIDALVLSRAAVSKREAREFLSNNSIQINGQVVTDLEYILEPTKAIEGKIIILRKGKKNYFMFRF